MSSTPRTPAASKFLLPRRSTQSSQAPRFQPTPRFASSGAVRSTQASRSIEDVDENEPDDVSASEPPSAEEDEDEDEDGLEGGLGNPRDGSRSPRRTRGRLLPGESIEVDSAAGSPGSADPSSPYDGMGIGQSGWRCNVIDAASSEGGSVPSSPLGSAHERPAAKRRKISISPLPSSSPLASSTRVGERKHRDALQVQSPGEIGIESPSPGLGPDPGLDQYADGDEEHSPALSDVEMDAKSHGLQQPTFRAPPRFKPLEDEIPAADLPDFFSPRRRGERYLPGGLAAELQGWLAEVREGQGKEGSVEPTMRVAVDGVRPGSAMKLVRGTRLDASQGQKRFILAGEGRVVELGRKPTVTPGSVAVIRQPFWDVDLDGVTWTVASDWTVE